MDDSRVLAALVAGVIGIISSLITIYWLKPKIDEKFHLFKLKEDYKHQEAKKIKESIGKYKNHLLKSAEFLHKRFKNFARNSDKTWLVADGDYTTNHYYLDSFVHRFLSFFAYIHLITEGLEFLDTTNSESSDLELLKYFRIAIDTMTEVQLFEGIEYDSNFQCDHFFRNKFDQYVSGIIDENSVLDFDTFESKKNEILPKVKPVFNYFDNLQSDENELRQERLKCLHCVVISILNEYGYDFNKTNTERLKQLKEKTKGMKFHKGLTEIVDKYKLKTTSENMKLIIRHYSKK